MAEEAGGLAQEGAFGFHPSKLLEERQGEDLRVREPLEGSVAAAPARVERDIGVVDLAEQSDDRFFQECGRWGMLCLGHLVLLWSGLRMALFLAHLTTQHTSRVKKGSKPLGSGPSSCPYSPECVEGWILRSSLAGSCISCRIGPVASGIQPVSCIALNTTSCGAGRLCSFVRSEE